jgi:hypothetical protein
MFVQVTRVPGLMVMLPGLNGPPPPAIVIPAVAVTRQLGEGLALGLGDGLGLPLCAFAALMLSSPAAVMIAACRMRLVVIMVVG